MNMRQVTTKARSRIPHEIETLMWNMLDSMDEDKDYLQIFKLSSINGKLLIHHYQEQPPWEEEVTLVIDCSINEKIYILVENGLETMMLAEDY